MREMRRITLLTVAVVLLLPFTAKPELPVKKVLTLDAARKIAAAAEPMMAAFPGLALNGTMVVLGAPAGNIAVNPMELIMVTIFSDVYFSNAGKLFDPTTGEVTDAAYGGRLDKFLNELVWMAHALRFGREQLPGS